LDTKEIILLNTSSTKYQKLFKTDERDKIHLKGEEEQKHKAQKVWILVEEKENSKTFNGPTRFFKLVSY
jgi:hypothetical protein